MATRWLPTKIKVGAYDYQVEDWHSNKSRAADRFGECDRINKVIRVDTSIGVRSLETLLHEILHAAWFEWNVQKGDDEERCIETLSFALATIMRDNPGLFAKIDHTRG